MKRFRFPLERLLWHRRLQEDLAEQALAGASMEERAMTEGLAQVRGQEIRESTSLRAALANCLSGADVVLHAGFAAALQARAATLRARRTAAAARRRECSDALRERRRAREAVAQLRERAWGRYREAAAREAQLALDELAGERHERQRVAAEE